jgi:serine protease DegQ
MREPGSAGDNPSMNTPATHSTSQLVALSGEIAAAVERISPSVVAVDAGRRRSSSGFSWDEHHVATADHALEDDDVTLTLHDGSTAKASIVGRDPSTDIALLHTDARLEAVPRGDLEALKVGHFVLAIGRDDDGGVAATLGVVSALDGPWRTWRGGDVDRFVRPDLSMYPGFSGGPLIEAAGGVVGMNTWGLSRRMALTVPLSTIARVVTQLETGGRIRRGYLGVAMQAVRIPDALREKTGIDGAGGLIVVDVAPGGPAESAGVLIGDVIVAVGGRRVEDPGDLQGSLRSDLVGTAQSLRVLRGGTPRDVDVVIGERPHDDD